MEPEQGLVYIILEGQPGLSRSIRERSSRESGRQGGACHAGCGRRFSASQGKKDHVQRPPVQLWNREAGNFQKLGLAKAEEAGHNEIDCPSCWG